MSQNDPYEPSQGGQYIPPPPAYQATSDIPPQSPYHYSPAPQQGNRGLLGWLVSAALAVWAVAKYGLLLLVKLPAGGTIISLIVSFGGYALVFGPWFAVALVVMILVHEMGHVVEIRRQGMQATAPIFSPFLIIFALLGIPTLIARFRERNNPYYTSVRAGGRWAIGLAWLGLVLYLGVMSLQAHGMLAQVAR